MRPTGGGPSLRPAARGASLPPTSSAPKSASPRGGKRAGPREQIRRVMRNPILLSFLALTLASLLGVILYVTVAGDDADDPKGAAAFSLEEWKGALEKRAKQSAPPHEALGLAQLVFVSCNRHDRSQAYWGYVAAAAQCEMVPTHVRARSAPCRRLYAGRSPVITTVRGAGASPTEAPVAVPAVPRDIPLGGCGSVVDSERARQYRAATKSGMWSDTMRAAAKTLQRHQRFFPAATSVPAAPPPLDALVWLGDAIYADKMADGKRTQHFGHVTNSLEEIKVMWATQRDAPMYDAFRGTCLRPEPPRAGAGAADDPAADEAVEGPGTAFYNMVAEMVHAWFGEGDGDDTVAAPPTAARAADEDAAPRPASAMAPPTEDEGDYGDTHDEHRLQAPGDAVDAVVDTILLTLLGDEDGDAEDAVVNEGRLLVDGMDGLLEEAADAGLDAHAVHVMNGGGGTWDAPPSVWATSDGRPSVYGTWDDHDMGENDAGKEYPYKNVTQKYLLDFLQAPEDDVRWQRPGVYAFHTLDFSDVFMADAVDSAAVFGGNERDNDRLRVMRETVMKALQEAYVHAVCLILLDVRSFRSKPDAYGTGDMLGDTQWQWLEKTMVEEMGIAPDGRESCALTLIGGGIQLIADEKTAENWAAFPGSRSRLFGLLRLHGVERVAFLTGDVHMGEIAADFTSRTIHHVLGYPVVEATSSGLTHSAAVKPGVATLLRAMFPSPKRRIGRLFVERNFGAVRLALNGALAMSQLDSILTTLSELATALAANTEELLTSRRRLRETLDAMVNVTFTVFSIPKRGMPVLRLNFPLSMLTYEGAQRYVEASVVPLRGYVYMTIPAGPVASVAPALTEPSLPKEELYTIRTFYPEGRRAVAHYYNNEAPLFTAYIRFVQRHLFPTLSISETIGRLIKIHAIGAILVLPIGMLWILRRVRKRIRPVMAAGAGGYSSSTAFATDSTELAKDEPVAVPFFNFISAKAEKVKEG